MSNSFFQFKQFIVHQDRSAMKVTTDGCLFGAWISSRISSFIRSTDLLLDIGTGTGLLSLMIAQQTNNYIDAVELDPDAFQQAKENILHSPWAEKISVHQQDVKDFKPLQHPDFIFSNPPFYENELRSGKSKKDLAHHHDGLTLKDLLAFIEKNLSVNGAAYLLLPAKRLPDLQKLILASSLAISHATFVRQTPAHGFFRIMAELKFSKEEILQSSDEITIRINEQEYSQEFIQLLKPYYLHL